MNATPGARWADLPLGRGVTLITADENGLAAFDKPAGVLSHPNEAGDEPRSLFQAAYTLEGEFYEWRPTAGGTRRVWLLNRLDSATSGVILVAATEELAREIRAHFKRKQVRKVYQALVFGSPRQTSELWSDRLAVQKRGGQIRTVASAGHIPAECQMTVTRVGRFGMAAPQSTATGTLRPQSSGAERRLALLRLEPRTGRSHQLRVQCAKRNLPIVGDQTYGNFARNREFAKATKVKRMFLHSLETSFEYEFKGRKHRFAAQAPLPPEFTAYM